MRCFHYALAIFASFLEMLWIQVGAEPLLGLCLVGVSPFIAANIVGYYVCKTQITQDESRVERKHIAESAASCKSIDYESLFLISDRPQPRPEFFNGELRKSDPLHDGCSRHKIRIGFAYKVLILYFFNSANGKSVGSG